MLDNSEDIYDISVADFLDVIRLETGETVAMEYKENGDSNLVLSLKVGDGKKEEVTDETKSEDAVDENTVSEDSGSEDATTE